MTTGRRLRQWANRVCSARTMEQLIDPVIADLQHEYERTKAAGQVLRAGFVLLRGHCAFWTVMMVHVPAIWLHRTIGGFRASYQESFIRAVMPAVITMVTLSVALIAVPAQRSNQHGLVGIWLLVLLLPQSIPFSIPLSLFTGIVCGLRRRPVTKKVCRTVVILGVAGTLVSASTIVWVVPVANQAFRTVIARRVLLEGPAEMSSRELRDRALALRNQGHTAKAGDLLFSYHARWALAGAALVFAVFGLGVTALRLGRVATVLVVATACVVYVNYFYELHELARPRLSVFSHEGVAFTLAWLPNLLMLLTSLAFLTKRDQRSPTSI
jgi:lipopolysaccharide export LptBFGC system permease protein LptF